jgi:hypothetical protein
MHDELGSDDDACNAARRHYLLPGRHEPLPARQGATDAGGYVATMPRGPLPLLTAAAALLWVLIVAPFAVLDRASLGRGGAVMAVAVVVASSGFEEASDRTSTARDRLAAVSLSMPSSAVSPAREGRPSVSAARRPLRKRRARLHIVAHERARSVLAIRMTAARKTAMDAASNGVESRDAAPASTTPTAVSTSPSTGVRCVVAPLELRRSSPMKLVTARVPTASAIHARGRSGERPPGRDHRQRPFPSKGTLSEGAD